MRSHKAETHERQCDTSNGSYNMDLMGKTVMRACGMRRSGLPLLRLCQ